MCSHREVEEHRARQYLDTHCRPDLFKPGMTQDDAAKAYKTCPREQERRARQYLDTNRRSDLFRSGMTLDDAVKAYYDEMN